MEREGEILSMKNKRLLKPSFLAALSASLYMLWIGNGMTFSFAFSEPRPSYSDTKNQNESKLAKRFARYMQYADEFFDQKLKKSFQSKHYIVITDHPDPSAAEEIALTSESIRAVYCSLFRDILPIREKEFLAHILLFKFAWQFERFYRKAFDEDPSETVGCYIHGTPIIASHYEHASKRDLLAVLCHNEVYQLNDQILYSKNAMPSFWINAGLAAYFAETKLGRKGTLKIGKLDWKSTYVKCVIPRIQRMIRKKNYIKLEDLISCDERKAFYEEDQTAYFSESWLFVHFLLHYMEGTYKKKFTEYMAHEIEGEGGLERFKKIFGSNLEPLEKKFLRYILQL